MPAANGKNLWCKSNQNPCEASSPSRILSILLVYVCICEFVCLFIFCHASQPYKKLYRPEIWTTYSNRPYLKPFFFEKITVTAASFEKLSCHLDFPYISSIAFPFPSVHCVLVFGLLSGRISLSKMIKEMGDLANGYI